MMTPKQYELFSFIRNQVIHFGKGPTFSEMKRFMTVTSNQTVGDWLAILEREGYISLTKGKLRGITITQKGTEGFDKFFKLQDQNSIQRSISPVFGTASAGISEFNSTKGSNSRVINLNVGEIAPAWKGGVNDGSS